MSTKIPLFLFLLLSSVFVANALPVCEESILDETDIPCYVLLPLNNSATICTTVTASYYLNTTFLYSQSMNDYTSFLCNSTFNQSAIGDYTIYFSTGDSGKINVLEATEMMFFNLTVYALLVIGSIIFILLAHKTGQEDDLTATPIVFGVLGATLSFIAMGMIFFGFQAIHGVTLFIDVNYYLGIFSLAIGLYALLCTFNYYKEVRQRVTDKRVQMYGY